MGWLIALGVRWSTCAERAKLPCSITVWKMRYSSSVMSAASLQQFRSCIHQHR